MDEVASYTSAQILHRSGFSFAVPSLPPPPTIGPFCEFMWVEGIRKLKPEVASLAPSRAEITLNMPPN